MIELFLKGGPLMYPLLAFSIITIALIIERGIIIGGAGISKSKLDGVINSIESTGITAALEQYKEIRSPLALFYRKVLLMVEMHKPEIDEWVSIEGARIIRALRRHLHLLELVGKVSPMVGLSGTVLGLTRTFQKVAGLQTMADPSTLAGGIWEALITTVTGLFVAIPAILCYHLYENRIKSISFEMKNHIETIVATLKEKEQK